LLPFSEDVVAPGEFAVQKFDVICTGKLFVVHVDRGAFSGEGNVNGLQCVSLHAPMEEPGLKRVEVVLEM
jgi:hypothetical protein